MASRDRRRLLFYAAAFYGAAFFAKLAGAQDSALLIPRNFTGVGNNVANPTWGSVGTTQIRAVAGAEYAADGFSPPGSLRPSAREVMTEVFLASEPAISTRSALFVAWGQLLAFDMYLNVDNSSEPFDIPCNDGAGLIDVWCPQGAASDDISFFRSDAAVDEDDAVRSPINYATAYIDLDFIYGRSVEEAAALRSLEGGLMNVTDTGVPFQNADGTWLVADQRTSQFPVTFALHIMLLLEHNRCCIDVAPGFDYEGDEDIYQACRAWTIALFQHVSENDYYIRLLGNAILTLEITDDDAVASIAATPPGPAPSLKGGKGRSGRARGLLGEREGGGGGGEGSDSTNQPYANVLSEEIRMGQESPKNERYGNANEVSKGGPVNSDASQLFPRGQGHSSFTSRRVSPNEAFVSFPREAAAAAAAGDSGGGGGGGASKSTPPHDRHRRLYSLSNYEDSTNPAADVFTLTVGAAAFESALPSNLRIVSEGYVPTAYDGVELTVAREDMAALFAKNTVEEILRGAVLAPALEIDTYFASAISNLSPLFKLPADGVQRGRDHGLPTYNAARVAFDLTAATDFSDVTSNDDLAALLSDAYGGDISLLDAVTGALAETPDSGNVLGELLLAAWTEQLYRSLAGDRFHHLHSRSIEDVSNTTLSQVMSRAANVTDVPLSVFDVPTSTVCAEDCTSVGAEDVTLSDSFKIAWEELDGDVLAITLEAKGIGEAGMLGIGFGGLSMADAQDFIICEVTSETEGECIDRSPTNARRTPQADAIGESELNVTLVAIDGEWTSITFRRELNSLDPDEDYDLSADIQNTDSETMVIYSYRAGSGIGQHPNANRGAATVNFLTGEVDEKCDDHDFASLHGALMLIAWLLLAPWGIYYIRYRKGETVNWAGYEWYEMHEEIMILAAEAVLPLGITAVFASGGNHTTSHAHWGYYMIAAVSVQLFTGWMRTKGLEAKHANFSCIHRFNKHFHIWSGRFAYLAGVVQCYRGLEMVASSDELIFSAGDGLDLQLGSFGWMKDIVFPIWLGLMTLSFVCLEIRKQYRRYFSKGAAKLCGFMEVLNEEALGRNQAPDRLVPRTENLPIYTMPEFNDKVLNGQSWVLVDGAILDVTNFPQRHPGGARLIHNAVGTDITHELLGEELSLGHAMSFSPHAHPKSAWEIVRSLVIGYVEDDEEEDDFWENADKERVPTMKLEGRRIRVAGREVLLMGGATRGPLGSNNLSNTAKRLNELAAIPDALEDDVSTGPEAHGTAAQGVVQTGCKELDHPMRRIVRGPSSSRRVLEQFHVCPLLFREKMGVSSPSGRGDLPTNRPVYKYVFSCPGQAQALVKAVSGVCYFNMRAHDAKKGVIQRSYNAFAVRVTDTAPATPGGGVRGGGGTGAGTRTIFPAKETDTGALCIEMRIRLYPDGAMSKLLEELAKATDNPAVQLQGPFIIERLLPPPVHRNVILIAAGTGINPMVQQIRDYQALSKSRETALFGKSRLVLVWQCVSEGELYGGDEITAMQAKSNGLMEVTVLISGDQRRWNVPGAAFKKATEKVMNRAKALVSPAFSASNNSLHAGSVTNASQRSAMHPPSQQISSSHQIHASGVGSFGLGHLPSLSGLSLGGPSVSGASFGGPNFNESIEDAGQQQQKKKKKGHRARRIFSRHLEKENSSLSVTSSVNCRKVDLEILRKAFGDSVLATLTEYNTPASSSAAAAARQRKGSIDENSEGEEKEGVCLIDMSSGSGVGAGEGGGGGDGTLEAIIGDEKTGGKLQVVVSGPSGFVFHVENLLGEMGVPPGAIVLLD